MERMERKARNGKAWLGMKKRGKNGKKV